MTETKEKAVAVSTKARGNARHEAEPRTYRTVLIAASVGVLIGLLVKR